MKPKSEKDFRFNRKNEKMLDEEDGIVTLHHINMTLKNHKPVKHVLNIFVAQNGGYIDHNVSDDLSLLDSLLSSSASTSNVLLPLLNTFKILLRKESNRKTLPAATIKSVLDILKHHDTPSTVRTAGSNVLLNASFERRNVSNICRERGVHILLSILKDKKKTANILEKISILGALQSICFVPEGRDCMRELEAESLFVNMLISASSFSSQQEQQQQQDKFIARVAGVLHNLSADPRSGMEIRKYHGIRPIVNLLRRYTSNPSIIISASGALQNLAREEKSRHEILNTSDLLSNLSQMLFSSNAEFQACAVGVLLSVFNNKKDFSWLKQLLSECVVLGSLQSAIFEEDDNSE